MGYLQAKQYLESLINYEIHLHKVDPKHFQLDRIKYLLNLLGDPQQHYKIIHVAGSKGKGSTSVMIATILDQAGFKVGLYTSPHLYDFKERIRILKKPYRSRRMNELFSDAITEKEITELVSRIKPFISQIHRKKKYGRATYFEILTAMSLLYFKEKKVDFTVLETGLGGRLDATNAVKTDMAVLTPISLEHANILGKTRTKIAEEKAGIIKDSSQAVVIAPQKQDVVSVFKKRCRQFAIKPRWVKKTSVQTNLLGSYQKLNASTAVCAIDYLREIGYDIPASAVKAGLENIFWPGRLEIVRNKPLVILDGAHNLDSVERLMESLKSLIGTKKVYLIFGAAKDKDIQGMLNLLKKVSKHIILANINHPRSFVFKSAPDVQSAVQSAIKLSSKEDIILITGSLYLISEARKCIS